MTEVLKSVANVKRTRERLKREAITIGFVPTMGALHEGHLELVRRAKSECARVFVSIFVNPTQFNDPRDLEKYPRTFEKDLELLQTAGCDFLFYPDPSQMYPDGYRYKVIETELSKKLCGAHRPGHFDGVLTVVLKLLNIVSPNKAYFGEKDFQQLQLIEGMVSSLFLDCQIVACPTVREDDGLAMSSRNARLSRKDREMAPAFYQILSTASSDSAAKEELEKLGFKVDYIETLGGRRFGAIFAGEVRLIDNVQI